MRLIIFMVYLMMIFWRNYKLIELDFLVILAKSQKIHDFFLNESIFVRILFINHFYVCNFVYSSWHKIRIVFYKKIFLVRVPLVLSCINEGYIFYFLSYSCIRSTQFWMCVLKHVLWNQWWILDHGIWSVHTH